MMLPSRNPKIGWNTQHRLFASSTSRSWAPMSWRIWVTCSFTRRSGWPPSRDAVLPEPRERSPPAAFRGFLAIGRPVVGVESVGRVGVGVDLRRAAFQRRAHAIDALVGNAGIGSAAEA